ncbi:NTP transferase domain-containing protein [Anoxybacteroides tepidamans]|uniref:NTP transferase domain-containing protein n=1 Tax=Anoxybacteroides tepidamans TaxID=265948 RepID=UPI0004852FD3|nr:NTP transferase domain-containing protein [Anoxybacillus tepidamans]
MTVPRTIGIYLAAGKSTRMGTDKRFLPFATYSLGSTALQAAISSLLSNILVVVPMDDTLDWIDPQLLQHGKCNIVRCTSSHGQSYSLRCGLHQAIQLHAEAAVVLLADQPFITKEVINELVCSYRQYRTDYVAFTQQSIPLPPILFSAAIFSDLLDVRGDEGARQLLRKSSNWNGTLLSSCNSDLFVDVDTIEDYQLANERWIQKGGIHHDRQKRHSQRSLG